MHSPRSGALPATFPQPLLIVSAAKEPLSDATWTGRVRAPAERVRRGAPLFAWAGVLLVQRLTFHFSLFIDPAGGRGVFSESRTFNSTGRGFSAPGRFTVEEDLSAVEQFLETGSDYDAPNSSRESPGLSSPSESIRPAPTALNVPFRARGPYQKISTSKPRTPRST